MARWAGAGLLQGAEVVELDPALRDLAPGEPIDDDARLGERLAGGGEPADGRVEVLPVRAGRPVAGDGGLALGEYRLHREREVGEGGAVQGEHVFVAAEARDGQATGQVADMAGGGGLVHDRRVRLVPDVGEDAADQRLVLLGRHRRSSGGDGAVYVQPAPPPCQDSAQFTAQNVSA